MFAMRRRDFFTFVGATAVMWPIAARAQQTRPMRRIGVLMPSTADDPEYQARVGAFLQALQQLGWIDRPQCADRHSLGHDQCRPTFAGMRRNWPRSRRTSSWPLAPRPCGRCCRRPAPCRSCFRSSPIRSAPASSTAWRGRAATPPASCFSNTA